jgi:hypothetical protein
MYYVCVSEGRVASIINYVPACVWPMQAYPISDTEYGQIQALTHYFDTTTCTVMSMPSQMLTRNTQQEDNQAHLRFLRDTDWQVLRHMRQLHLGEPTSLTAEAYTQLEQERSRVAALIQTL